MLKRYSNCSIWAVNSPFFLMSGNSKILDISNNAWIANENPTDNRLENGALADATKSRYKANASRILKFRSATGR
jgi:hypothetical protein